jgi:hypothetical protein
MVKCVSSHFKAVDGRDRMPVIALASVKGGAGKTSAALALAADIASDGERVCSASVSDSMAAGAEREKPSATPNEVGQPDRAGEHLRPSGQPITLAHKVKFGPCPTVLSLSFM